MEISKGKQEKEGNKGPQRIKEEGRGTVKSVVSGDTIVVVQLGEKSTGPPPERIISLSNVMAPRMAARRSDSKEQKEDEPFAWQSRDFLRKKCIGKPVSFALETKTANKEYGYVWLGNELQNLAELIVSEGWAKVRVPNVSKESYRPEVQKLVELEEQAQSNEKGLWTKKQDQIDKSKRTLPAVNPPELFEKLKGKPQTGILEYVRTGSSLRITLLPNFYDINLLLSGVECPGQDKEGNWSPFGKEAKFFTDHYLLNRDIQVLIEGADKFNFYGTVSYSGKNIAVELLKSGLGKFVEWSAVKSNFLETLRTAEQEAKKGKLRIWAGFEEPKVVPGVKEDKKAYKVGREILGVGTEIVNGGFIKILDQGRNEHKLYLSSIKLPRNGSYIADRKSNEDRTESVDRTLAWDAREHLRKRLVGQKVRAVIDYIRTPEQAPKDRLPSGRPLETRYYCSVYFERNNVAVELVERGLASAINHQGTDLRSKDYEQIVFAEQRAKKALKGVFANKATAPILKLRDLTIIEIKNAEPSEKTKEGKARDGRAYLESLKRGGRMRAVVETEFSGARFKLWVPKEHCLLAFSVAGIKCPKAIEEYGAEAKAFIKERIHQRDVEIEVLNFIEKSATFVGNIWINHENIATMLLEQGFAEVIPGALRDLAFGNDYYNAQVVAQKTRKNIWKDYDEEKVKEARAKAEEKKKAKQEFLDVLVTEILDGSNFYIQIVGPEAQALEELMKALALDDTPGVVPKVGDFVKAQFTADDQWYRARVTKVTPEGNFHVFYVDYGNEEEIPAARIRQLPEGMTELKDQAYRASLAFIKTNLVNEDYGQEAADFFRELVWGKSMLAQIESRDEGGKVFSLSLFDRESQVHVNAALLRAGLAKLDRKKTPRHMYGKLKEQQEKAREAHVYMWEYGDPGSSDEEEIPKKTKGKSKS